MNIMFSILSCANHIETRQKAIKNTWLHNKNNYIFASDITNQDNILLTNEIGHKSAMIKQFKVFEYLVNNKNNYDWYFFCDDDTYVNIKNLEYIVYNFDDNINNFGNVLSINKDPRNPAWNYLDHKFQYFSGGSGFGFRKDLLEKVVNYNKPINDKYSDILVGRILKCFNINLYDQERMYSDNLYNLNHDINQILNTITYHYMNPEMMLQLNNFIKDYNE